MKLDPNFDAFSPNTPCWQYSQEGGTKRPINRDILFKNVCDIHEVFNKYGIVHWLSHGTVLGVYREQNFIAHDDDADFSMYFSQRNSKELEMAIQELKDLGFYVPASDPNIPVSNSNAPYYDVVFIRDGEKTEFWCFEKIGDEYIYDKERSGRSLAHPAHFYDTLDTIDFKGVKFNTPHNLHDYLVMMYGNSYMIPDPNKKYNEQK